MEILKKGELKNLKKTMKFICNECGCIFLADKGEYRYATVQWEEDYSCNCPTCNHTVFSTEKIGW